MPFAWLISVVLASAVPGPADTPFPLDVRPTELLRRSPHGPSAVIRVSLRRPLALPAIVTVRTADGAVLFESAPAHNAPGNEWSVAVPAPAAGDTTRIRVEVDEGQARPSSEIEVPRPDDGRVMHFIPGFHYDPVWWNTQAHYTETGYRMADAVGPGLTLVAEYLRQCFEDPDYTVALHQLPYLKTFLEARPQHREDLLARIAEGRCAIVGGTYNELSTTLISAESTARNAIYGTLFQTEVLKGDGHVWWQCDVFGHDPSFPSLMQASGHHAGAFARGPFHQWGAPREQVNFPSEFMWMAPDGRAVLTHYMTGHYGYAYALLATGGNRAPDDRVRCEAIVAGMFEDLRRPALTRHVLLPMHMDFIRPLENLGQVCRQWNETYLSPQARMSTPRAFFDAVRGEIASRQLIPTVITRDMNPVYTGCPVSFADLKTAQRACEVTLREAEIFATLAALEGAPYPWARVDRAWRQLQFNAHHDAVTGSMSDQVYLDVMYAYRDCLETARHVREWALGVLNEIFVSGAVSGAAVEGDHSASQVLWNSLASARAAGPPACDSGTEVPAVGFSCVSAGQRPSESTVRRDIHVLENEHLRVRVDPQNATIAEFVEHVTGRQMLRAPGNDVVLLEEYDTLPGHGEGPWHLSPTGTRLGGAGLAAEMLPADNARPNALRYRVSHPLFTRIVTYELQSGSRTLDMETAIVDWKGSNMLLRVEFPVDLPGARPVYQTAAAVIARPFARDVDTAEDAWTLDQTCWQWAGLGSVSTLELGSSSAPGSRRALGVAEIVYDDGGDVGSDAAHERNEQSALRLAGQLAEALVKAGVTSTITHVDARRYGDLTYDSNTPDFRIGIGVSEAVLRAVGFDADSATLPSGPGRDGVPEASWFEPAEGLPFLVLPHASFATVRRDLDALHIIRALDGTPEREPRDAIAADAGAVLINRGPVSMHITEDGTIGLNLMRSCTSWPAGVWIDKPRRRLPDGAALETMHGSHRFAYSFYAHAGDFRAGGVNGIAQAVNHPLIPMPVRAACGPSAARSFVSVEPSSVRLAAMKPLGYPEARWRNHVADPREPLSRVVLRLWNGAGKTVLARVKVHRFAGSAWHADLLEHPGQELAVRDGQVEVPLGPNAYETLICDVHAAPGRPALAMDTPSPSTSAYWLENLGEGNFGNGVLALAPAVREVRRDDGPLSFAVRVVNNHRTEALDVRLSLEAAALLGARLSEDRVHVPPASDQEVTVTLDVDGDVDRRVLLGMNAHSQHGNAVSTGIWVLPAAGDDREPVEIINASPIVPAHGTLEAEIVNHTAGPLTGTAAWLSPQVLWDHTPHGSWTERVTIPATGRRTVRLPVSGAPDTYAILRFTVGGRVHYGASIAVVQDTAKVFVVPDVDRVRCRAGQAGTLSVAATSLGGIHESTPISPAVSPGWGRITELDRSLHRGACDTLKMRYVLEPTGQMDSATITLTGPGGSVATVAASVVPVQRARGAAGDVRIDGRLDEWTADEFTEATADLGSMRAAVRYAADGLALAFDVEDQYFAQEHGGAALWQGDSVQFGLSTVPSTAVGYQEHDYEYGAGLTPEGPVVWCWIAGDDARTGWIDTARVAIEVDAGRARYEIFLPRAELPLPPLEPGQVLGFSYIANDNDGQGFRGAVQWTRGLSGKKDPSLFGDLILVE